MKDNWLDEVEKYKLLEKSKIQNLKRAQELEVQEAERQRLGVLGAENERQASFRDFCQTNIANLGIEALLTDIQSQIWHSGYLRTDLSFKPQLEYARYNFGLEYDFIPRRRIYAYGTYGTDNHPSPDEPTQKFMDNPAYTIINFAIVAGGLHLIPTLGKPTITGKPYQSLDDLALNIASKVVYPKTDIKDTWITHGTIHESVTVGTENVRLSSLSNLDSISEMIKLFLVKDCAYRSTHHHLPADLKLQQSLMGRLQSYFCRRETDPNDYWSY